MLAACRPNVRNRTAGAALVEYRRFMRSMAAIMGRLCRWRSVSYSSKCCMAPAKPRGEEEDYRPVKHLSLKAYAHSSCVFCIH